MAEIRQKIFKRVYVGELRSRLRDGSSLHEYFSETFSPPESELLETTLVVHEEDLDLKILESGNQSDADMENAIKLYGIYKDLNETQASDPRLWTYLSHCTFRKYAMRRWGMDGSYEDLVKIDTSKQKAQNYYLSHWFAGGSDRALRRNAIARLWWAAHLTVAPWDRHPTLFIGREVESSDPFRYTKILFSTQDVFQQVLERGLGRDASILIPVLDYIDAHKPVTREQVRGIMKELNLIASVRNTSLLSRIEIDQLLASIKVPGTKS